LLPRHYSGSSLIRTLPPPSRLSIHFPLSTVIESTLLQAFLLGTRRASPVAMTPLFFPIVFFMVLNHYHVLLQTPDANLSRFMHHVDGVYTQRFNRYHHYDGQLFRGRYKSILVDADSYLLQLVRYIHRNPLQSGLANKLEAYKWCSHNGYVSDAKKWNWLHKDFIL